MTTNNQIFAIQENIVDQKESQERQQAISSLEKLNASLIETGKKKQILADNQVKVQEEIQEKERQISSDLEYIRAQQKLLEDTQKYNEKTIDQIKNLKQENGCPIRISILESQLESIQNYLLLLKTNIEEGMVGLLKTKYSITEDQEKLMFMAGFMKTLDQVSLSIEGKIKATKTQ